MGREGGVRRIGPPLLGAEVGPRWAGTGVPAAAAGEAGELWKVEVVVRAPPEAAECLRVVPGLGPGVAGG